MIEVRLEGCIYELKFGYNAKMEGYTYISSDIQRYPPSLNREEEINDRERNNKVKQPYCVY